MKVQQAVKRSTAIVAVGVLLMSAVMVAVFALMGKYDWTVLLGALWGSLFAVLNFFLMGLGVQAAADLAAAGTEELPDEDQPDDEPGVKERPLTEAEKKVRKRVQLSYSARMIMLVLAALIALAAPCFQTVAAVLPILFPQVVIRFQSLFEKKEA